MILMLIPLHGFQQEILTLGKALETGMENNFSIRLQRNNSEIAKNNNTLGNAGFLPSVNLNITQNNSISTTHQEQFSGTVKDIDNAKSNSLNAGIQINWTVFDGMSMFASHRMLLILEELGENGTRIVMEDFVADVSTLYFGIVQMKRLVKVARKALDLSGERKKIAEAKLSIGSGSQLMLLQSTVDRNADSTRLLQQLTTLANLKADLNQLLGREITHEFETTDSILFSGIPKIDSIFILAERQNSQLTAARMNSQLARHSVREAQSDRYPRINLTGGYSFGALSSETGFLQQNRSYGPSYGINLSYSLFNGFNVTRAVKNAKVMMNSADLGVEETALNLRASLVKLLNQYRSNTGIATLQAENVVVAQENLNIAFEKYRLGTLNDIEFRDIQRKLIEADYEYISAQFEIRKTEIEIFRYCGLLLR
jgi:outer membrane protein TolC